jgi:diguanylate cyclase (GGDEF)-like protein
LGPGSLLEHQGELFTATGLLALLGPTLSLLFAAAFFGSWCWRRRLRYLLYLAVSCTLFGVGAVGQTLGVPHDIRWSFMVSAVVYAAALIALVNGALERMRLKLRYTSRLSITGIALAGVAYFCFAHPSMKAALYWMNFGFSVLLVMDAMYLRSAAMNTGKIIDRLVYWMILLLGLQVVPRTLLSFGNAGQTPDVASFAHSNYWIWVNATYALLVVLIGGTMLAALMVDMMAELRGQADTDPLTGLLNRRGFEEAVQRRVAKAKGRCFSIAVCDVDHFKKINDSYGHVEGDAVLKRIAALLRQNLRGSDEAARFGGEEFVLLLSDVHRDDASALIERLRQMVEETRFGNGSLRRITASFGVAEYRAGEELEHAIRRADRMLYAAKRNGRNQALVDWLRVELQVPMRDGARPQVVN